MALLPVSSPDERLLANLDCNDADAPSDAPQTSGNKGEESVITQFMGNAKGAGSASVAQIRQKMGELAAAGQADGAQSRIWKSILCCLRPQGDEELKKAGLKKEGGAETRPEPRRVMHPVRRPVRCVLPPVSKADGGKKCLVLDLDETLVHSSFKPVANPDFIIPVEIDNRITDVYVLKRPFVDEFLQAMGQKYEVVVFTASLSKYADPLLDLLDPHQTIRHRLFREHCCPYEGNYVKDLSVLGRDLASTIIIDNSPHSYIFHPENAVAISTFIDEPEDCELMELIPYLNAVADVDDVRLVLAGAQ